MLDAVTAGNLAELQFDKLTDVLLRQVCDLFEVDTATVLLGDASGERLVASASVGLSEEVFQGVRVPIGVGFAGRIASQRKPVQLLRVDSSTVVNPLLWQRNLQVLLGVPMIAQGQLVGVLHIGRLSPRQFADEDAELLRLVADRIAVAAFLHRVQAEQSAAALLVDSLLPPQLPSAEGWELAARYVPGAAIGVGGDWYDVFPLREDRIGVVIGDVAGNGLPAAVVMGRLRSALRAYALEYDDPAVVLRLLDHKATHFERTAMATVGYMILNTASGTMDVALAGHLRPLVAMPGADTTFVDVPVCMPVGFGLAARRLASASVDLPVGSLVVCYTDGLVERRHISIDDRLEQLRGTVRPGPPEAVCAQIMNAMVGGEPADDDVALVVLLRSS